MSTHYGKLVSLNPIKVKTNDKVVQTLRTRRITIIPKKSIPEEFLTEIL